ncbi:MAG: hypothetical protein LW704_02600, partial [Cryomorphaceae bacterium]|nr:hypothetical protein [Cryomorphaceae bacterium]
KDSCATEPFLASGATDIPKRTVAPRSLFWRVVQLTSPKGQLRHGAFFGEWCKSFFQGCATEPNE